MWSAISKIKDFNDFVSMIKMNDFFNKKKQEEIIIEEQKKKNTLLIILAVIGAIAAVAGIAYLVYRYLTPDYLEDFDDDDF